MTLAPGYHAVPDGHLATIVTDLEMTPPPPARAASDVPGLSLDPVAAPGLDRYRALIRAVGADWLWQERLAMGDAALGAVLSDPLVELHVLRRAGADAADADVGILELDFREGGACEIAFFGVVAALQGTGAARWTMTRALEIAFGRGVGRVWLHTCTLDHPAALDFYRRTGFRPVRQRVEVLPDPRLRGLLPRDAAPHVPLAGVPGRG